jgi:hypothetical protein
MQLAGIKVSVMNAFNAMPLADTVADSTGYSFFSPKGILVPYCAQVKVRFSDPNGFYLPQYYGTNGQDIFEKGLPVNMNVEASTSMVKLTPSISIDNFANSVNNSSLPPDTATVMSARLSRAKDIVNDSNPNNDVAACGTLKSIINEINAMQNSGKLSAYEADALRQSAVTASTTIGCK